MTSGYCYDAAPDLFTDKQRDPETGLDYFGARYNASSLGRFMTPDWSKNPTGVPYADFANPQSLNLYGYVLNNPVTRIDPNGHIDCSGKNAQGAGCQQILKWDRQFGISSTAKESNDPGVPVELPNGKTVSDPHSGTGLLMSPTANLSNVAAAGRKAKGDWTSVGLALDLGKTVGTGGKFDYQRMGSQWDVLKGGFQQLPKFRDASNFNVGLFAQQAGLSLDQILKLAGDFARHFPATTAQALLTDLIL